MASDLFVYGTLIDPAVRAALFGRAGAVRPARLHGWRRVLVEGADYPALARAPGCTVAGLLTRPPGHDAFRLLDIYEDDEYERRACWVSTDARLVRATIYLTVPDVSLARRPWPPGWRRRRAGAVSLCASIRRSARRA